MCAHYGRGGMGCVGCLRFVGCGVCVCVCVCVGRMGFGDGMFSDETERLKPFITNTKRAD